jgi:hypothetical protein
MTSRLIRDPGTFSGKRTKFADWWKIMMLFLKFNNVTQAKQKIIIVTSRMERGVPGFHAKQWQKRNIKGGGTASWDKFEGEMKQGFGLGNKEELARNQIEDFNISMTSLSNSPPLPKWQGLMTYMQSSYSNNTPNIISSKQSWDTHQHLFLQP